MAGAATRVGMERLLPSPDRIQRTIEVESAYRVERLQVLARLPGNPMGVAIRVLAGGGVASMARELPSPPFNSVTGLRPGDESLIEPLIAWYREAGVPGRFEIVPGCEGELCRELARHGYFQSSFHASLIGAPGLTVVPARGVSIEAVTSEALMDEFLSTYVAGWEIREEHRARFKANVRPWLYQPRWSLFLGRFEGRPAAAGTLYLDGRVGYLADAATDPGFRGRGLHAALLGCRFAAAHAADTEFVCSGAAFLSVSHRNMERVGMRLQFVRAIWTPL
jgi:hypothetical protein